MDWIESLDLTISPLAPWNYMLLALLVAVEGPAATLIGAAMASTHTMRLPWVFVAASVGNLIADSLWYFLGYTGQMRFVYRIGHRFGVKSSQIQRLEVGLKQNAVKGLLIAKLTSGLVIPSLVVAGLLKVPLRKWFFPVLIAEMVWTGTLVLLGYYATSWITQIEQGLQIGVIGGIVVFALVFIYWLRRR